MAVILKEINRLAFVIAPVFWHLVYRSVAAVIMGCIIVAATKLFARYISPDGRGVLWEAMVLVLILPFISDPIANTTSVMRYLEPIEDISYRYEYDLYEQQYFLARQTPEDEIEIYGMTDVQLEQKVGDLYVKSLICDVALPLIWLRGMTAGFLWLIYTLYKLNRQIKTTGRSASRWIENIDIDDEFLASARQRTEIIITDIVSVPAVTGVFKGKILLPSYVEQMDEQTVKAILMHELGHMSYWHTATNMLLLAVQTVYWFNPVIGWLFGKSKQSMEIEVDALVVNHTHQGAAYAKAMVQVLAYNADSQFNRHLMCISDSAENMKKRIENINRKDFFKKYSVTLMITATLFYLVLIGLFFPTVDANEKQQVAFADEKGAQAVEKRSSIDVQHMNIECTLPWNWTVQSTVTTPRPETDIPLPPGRFDYTVDLYQDDELIGYIGMSAFEPYTEEIPQEEYHKTVWPGLRLSSMCVWDPFVSLTTTGKCENGLVDIQYVDYEYMAENPGTAVAAAPQYETFGILAYDKEEKMFCGFAFLPGRVSRETATKIALSVTMSNSGGEIQEHMGIVYKQVSLDLNGRKFTCTLPDSWTVTADGGEVNSAGVPVPLGHYDEVAATVNILDDGELIGCIGVCGFTPYTGEIAPEKYWETVFPSLRLSSFFSWNNFYPIAETQNGEYGLADIDYLDYTKLEVYPGRNPSAPNLKGHGVWAYDKEKEFFVCMAFIDGTVHQFTLQNIARFIAFE